MNPAFFKVLAARVERLEKNLATAEARIKELEVKAEKRGPGRPPKE